MLLLALGAWSCKDVLEPDLSKKSITLVAPNDNDTTANSQVTFWWQKLDEQNAYKYRLQVVKPNFTTPQLLIVDTLVSDYKFTASLYPGNYQWRVRSENNASSTLYVTRSLVVDSAKDLSNQFVSLISPSNVELNSQTVNFTWNQLFAAQYYTLKVYKMQGTIANLEASIPSIVGTAYTYTVASYGVYQWRMTAENANSNTPLSNANTFTVALRKPDNLTGQDSVTVPTTVVLNWLNYSPAIGDTIQIYKDNTSSAAIVNAYVTNRTYSYSTNGAGAATHWYYWRVKSVDALNNTSSWTAFKQFKVK